jgi:hypothetical protein
MAGPTNTFFMSGQANPFSYIVPGQNQITLNITGWTWDEEINTLIVTHSGSGGVAARIPNVLDGKGTVNADFDLLNPVYATPPILVAGQSGIAQYYVSPSRAWQVPNIIKKLHFESTVMGKVSYSFDCEMNSLQGAYVRPAP